MSYAKTIIVPGKKITFLVKFSRGVENRLSVGCSRKISLLRISFSGPVGIKMAVLNFLGLKPKIVNSSLGFLQNHRKLSLISKFKQ